MQFDPTFLNSLAVGPNSIFCAFHAIVSLLPPPDGPPSGPLYEVLEGRLRGLLCTFECCGQHAYMASMALQASTYVDERPRRKPTWNFFRCVAYR